LNKVELRGVVEEYLKRTDFSAALFDYWVGLTSSRIGTTLRGQVNLVVTVLTPVVNPLQLPLDLRQVRSVEWFGNNASFRVRSAEAAINTLPLAGQSPGPLYYRVAGFTMELRPFFATPLTIAYWSAPAGLPIDSSTNDILEAQPQLYVYGCLIEASIWAQDPAMATAMAAIFNDEIAKLDLQGSNVNAGDSPAMGVF
jgi:hypothetical protein